LPRLNHPQPTPNRCANDAARTVNNGAYSAIVLMPKSVIIKMWRLRGILFKAT
jgi:hypothetical protein